MAARPVSSKTGIGMCALVPHTTSSWILDHPLSRMMTDKGTNGLRLQRGQRLYRLYIVTLKAVWIFYGLGFNPLTRGFDVASCITAL